MRLFGRHFRLDTGQQRRTGRLGPLWVGGPVRREPAAKRLKVSAFERTVTCFRNDGVVGSSPSSGTSPLRGSGDRSDTISRGPTGRPESLWTCCD